MQSIQHLTSDMARRLPQLPLDAVQGDGNTRAVEIALLENGEPWNMPAGVTAAVAFRKADGKKGLYDALPDGTKAVTFEGNTVTAILAPQVLTCPGDTYAAVVFHDAALNQLATFPFTIRVRANPAAGQDVSNDYYRYSTMEAVSQAIDAFLTKAEEALAVVHDTATEDAPAIVCETSGTAVTIADASDRPLQGLKLFGKTTQNSTPTPGKPAALESIGESIGVTVAGKNLFDDIGWFESNGFTKQSDGSWLGVLMNTTCFTNTAKTKGAMHITAIAKTEDTTNPLYFVAYYTDGTHKSSPNLKQTTEFVTLTLETDPEKTVDYIKWTWGSGGTYCIKGVMISFADNGYEPYKETQTLAVSAPNGLNGVPMPRNVNDGFTYTYDYIDADGNPRIADYVDAAKGVLVQRFKRYKVSKAYDFHDAKNGFGQFFLLLPSDRKLGSYCLCSHYHVPIDHDGTLYSNPTYTGVIYKRISSNPGMLVIAHEGITTLDDYNAWLAENQPEFLYELAQPIETPLSAEALAAYAALHSNKPNTTVFNDAGAEMKVAYVADTKTYIDQKLAAVSKAILG